jgi:hypothetical protein
VNANAAAAPAPTAARVTISSQRRRSLSTPELSTAAGTDPTSYLAFVPKSTTLTVSRRIFRSSQSEKFST